MELLTSYTYSGDDHQWYVVYEGQTLARAYDSKYEAEMALKELKQIDSRVEIKEGQQLL